MSLAHHFVTEAYNNAWSNHRLLRACLQLTADEFRARRVSFFPSIKATLNHIVTVDWYYLEMLERSRAGLPPHERAHRHFDPREPFDDCAALSEAQHAADRRLVAYCESLADQQLDDVVLVPRRAGTERDRVRRILARPRTGNLHTPRRPSRRGRLQPGIWRLTRRLCRQRHRRPHRGGTGSRPAPPRRRG